MGMDFSMKLPVSAHIQHAQSHLIPLASSGLSYTSIHRSPIGQGQLNFFKSFYRSKILGKKSHAQCDTTVFKCITIRVCRTAHAIFSPKFWNDKMNFTRVFVTVSPRRPWDRGWSFDLLCQSRSLFTSVKTPAALICASNTINHVLYEMCMHRIP